MSRCAGQGNKSEAQGALQTAAVPHLQEGDHLFPVHAVRGQAGAQALQLAQRQLGAQLLRLVVAKQAGTSIGCAQVASRQVSGGLRGCRHKRGFCPEILPACDRRSI